jgi:hypothetical protein
MKKVILFAALIIGLSSCEFYYLEPRIDERDRLVGRYSIEEYSETYNDITHYTISIHRSGYRSNEVVIDNFYGVDLRIYATVSYDKITIYRQVVNGYEVEGVGTIYGDEISFHYHVKDRYTNSRTDYCESSAWRY